MLFSTVRKMADTITQIEIHGNEAANSGMFYLLLRGMVTRVMGSKAFRQLEI